MNPKPVLVSKVVMVQSNDFNNVKLKKHPLNCQSFFVGLVTLVTGAIIVQSSIQKNKNDLDDHKI